MVVWWCGHGRTRTTSGCRCHRTPTSRPPGTTPSWNRFVADHSWEEPVDTAVRLLARELVDLDWFRRWNCLPPPWGLGLSVGDRGEKAHITLRFRVEDSFRATAFRHYTMAVTGNEPVEDQVRRFAERIDTSDPRAAAQTS
ncbi:hypothetical protein [Streptomyces sp. NPDC127114]|uniref:hypothetical protein n=1 Tax=Streptomyces sp. NPDC127114 TaxID=3345366 RepID=UPI003626D411